MVDAILNQIEANYSTFRRYREGRNDLSDLEYRLTAEEYADFMRAVDEIQTAIRLSLGVPPSYFANAVGLGSAATMYEEWARMRNYQLFQRVACDSIDIPPIKPKSNQQ